MHEIPGPDDMNAFILGPKVKILKIQIFSGGAGVFGMDMQVCNEFHVLNHNAYKFIGHYDKFLDGRFLHVFGHIRISQTNFA